MEKQLGQDEKMVVRACYIFAMEKGIKLEVNKAGTKPVVLY